MARNSPTRTPPRRWWQVLCRWAVRLLVLLSAAYATLPWWAPTGLIARRLAARMSEQMGVDVRIESVRLSWADGITVRNLTIHSADAFGRATLAEVDTIRTELSPVDLLVRERLSWMEMVQPRLYLRVDAAGNLNVQPLLRMEADVQPRRISIHGGLATLKLADDPRIVSLRVPSLQFDAGRARRITMSAALEQPDEVGEAPMSLSPRMGSPADAAASFSFANVDLSQLPLVALLNLPIKSLSGRAAGSVDLTIDRDGVMDGFQLDAEIRRLEVCPAAGAALPVIEEAGLHVRAAYDHVTDVLDIRSASVRLPGVDLTGQAKVFTQVFEGHWEAIESMSVKGEVYPAQLAALLADEGRLPGELELTGSVAVEVAAERTGRGLRLRLGADAGAATVARGRLAMKPAGRKLRLTLLGVLDHRTGRFDASENTLTIGENRFSGYGVVQSVGRVLDRLARRGSRSIAEAAMDELARIDWQGSWRIGEAGSLWDLLGAAGKRLPPVRLDGPVTGRWYLKHDAGQRVYVGFNVPASTKLAVGDRFVKPDGLPMDLDVNLGFDSNGAAPSAVAVDLSVGEARLHVDRMKIRPGRSASPDQEEQEKTFAAEGHFSVLKLETLLAGVPAARQFGGSLQGALSGRFSARLAGERREVDLYVDAKDTAVAVDGWLSKPAGQDADVSVRLLTDEAADPNGRHALRCTWASAAAEAKVDCVLPDGSAGAAAGVEGLSVELDVRDVGKLSSWMPGLRKLIGTAELDGKLSATLRGSVREGRLEGEAYCDATELAAADGRGRRKKAAGTKLTVRLDGQVGQADGRLTGLLRSGRIEVGGSRLDLTGRVEADRPAAGPDGPWEPPWQLRTYTVEATASPVIEGPLRNLLPELEPWIRRLGLSGRAEAHVSAESDGERVRLTCRLDATELAARAELPTTRPASTQPAMANVLADLGPLVKPAGLAATADLTAIVPADLSDVRVEKLTARLGGVEVGAAGSADVVCDAEGRPVGAEQMCGRLAVTVGRAEKLAAMLPALKRYRLSGGATVRVTAGDFGGGDISGVTVTFRKLAGRLKGKDVLLDGGLTVEGLAFGDLGGWLARVKAGQRREDLLPTVARVATEGLEFRVGTNHGWLLADVKNLPHKADGRFELLADRIDVQDLIDWAALPGEGGPATGSAGPTSRPPYKLTEGRRQELRKQAGELIAYLRRYLGKAELNGRADIKYLKTYDISVDHFYETRRLALTVSASGGHVRLAYTGGLNGGSIRESYAFYLEDPAQKVACRSELKNVLAEKNIQPQLAKFFPGNAVLGTFSREETTTTSLTDFLAAAIDPRYPMRRTGKGKTVAVDGVTQGRAAPKFVTKVFTGLNLAKYRYRKMTVFAEYLADGTAVNDMVFDGKTYDLYIEGTTDAENMGHYEIGLILLGTPQSARWNHVYRQGRIPILDFRARIEGGRMHDERVSYPWPNETLFVIFLKNNLFYRTWLAAGKSKGKGGS